MTTRRRQTLGFGSNPRASVAPPNPVGRHPANLRAPQPLILMRPEKPHPELPALMTARELAAQLRIDTRTLRRWRAAGLVPEPLVFGRSVRWRRTEIEKWIF